MQRVSYGYGIGWTMLSATVKGCEFGLFCSLFNVRAGLRCPKKDRRTFAAVGIAVGSYTCGIVFSVRASRILHQKLLYRVLHAPIAFFDTVPLGRCVKFKGDSA